MESVCFTHCFDISYPVQHRKLQVRRYSCRRQYEIQIRYRIELRSIQRAKALISIANENSNLLVKLEMFLKIFVVTVCAHRTLQFITSFVRPLDQSKRAFYSVCCINTKYLADE